MWKKIKNIFSIIGACITIVCITIVLVLLRRGKADGRGSTGTDERDSAIQAGIESSEDRIDRSQAGIERCEEHLQRAEEILRNAIRRSREGESDNG